MTILIESNLESRLQTKLENDGILMHTIEASKESKGAWSELYLYDNEIYNVVYTDRQDAWLAFIEKLESVTELDTFVGDEKADEMIKEFSL